jgi:hypothetical protein
VITKQEKRSNEETNKQIETQEEKLNDVTCEIYDDKSVNTLPQAF